MNKNISNIINNTLSWLRESVIKYQFCPYAKPPFQKQEIGYEVFSGNSIFGLLEHLARCCLELDKKTVKQLETTLLIVADTNIPTESSYLHDFYDYLDVLEITNDFLDNPLLFTPEFSCEFQKKHLKSVPKSWSEHYQLASFHPEYQFENTDSNERQNYTNRSPYPIFHIIRNESIEHVRMNDEKALEIVDRNIDTLHNLSDNAFQILKKLAAPSQD